MQETNELTQTQTQILELEALESNYQQQYHDQGDSPAISQDLEHVKTLFELAKRVMKLDFSKKFLTSIIWENKGLISKAQTVRDHLEKLEVSDENYRLVIFVLKLHGIMEKFLNGDQKIPDKIKKNYPKKSVEKLLRNFIAFFKRKSDRKDQIMRNKSIEFTQLNESLQKVLDDKEIFCINPNFTTFKALIEKIDNLYKECLTKKDELASLQKSSEFPDSLPDYENGSKETTFKTDITTFLTTFTEFLNTTETDLKTAKRILIEKTLAGENAQLIDCQSRIHSAFNACNKFEVINIDPQSGGAQEDQTIRIQNLELQKKALDEAHHAIENNISVLKEQQQKLNEMQNRKYPEEQGFTDLKRNLMNPVQEIEGKIGLMQEKLAKINNNRTKVELLLQENVQDQVSVLLKNIQNNITETDPRIEEDLALNEQKTNNLNAKQEKLNGEQKILESLIKTKKESHTNNKLLNDLEEIKKLLEPRGYIPFTRIGRIYEFNDLLSQLDLQVEQLEKWKGFYKETTGKNTKSWGEYGDSWKKYLASYVKGKTNEKNRTYCLELTQIIKNKICQINEQQNQELKDLEEQKKQLDIQINNLQNQRTLNANNKAQLQLQKSIQEKKQQAIPLLQTLARETQQLIERVEQRTHKLKEKLKAKDQIDNGALVFVDLNEINRLEFDLQNIKDLSTGFFNQDKLDIDKSLSLLDESIREQKKLFQVQQEVLNCLENTQAAVKQFNENKNSSPQDFFQISNIVTKCENAAINLKQAIERLYVKNEESADLQNALESQMGIVSSIAEQFKDLKVELVKKIKILKDQRHTVEMEFELNLQLEVEQKDVTVWIKNLFISSTNDKKTRYVEELRRAIQGYINTGYTEALFKKITDAPQRLKPDNSFQKMLNRLKTKVTELEKNINIAEGAINKNTETPSKGQKFEDPSDKRNFQSLKIEFENIFNSQRRRICLFGCINTALGQKEENFILNSVKILNAVKNNRADLDQLLTKIDEYRKPPNKVNSRFEKILTKLEYTIKAEIHKQEQQQNESDQTALSNT
jgi:hypothetical protein